MLVESAAVEVVSADEVFLARVREKINDSIGQTGFGVAELASDLSMSRRQLWPRT